MTTRATPTPPPAVIRLAARVDWRYTSLPHVGRCRIDGEPLTLRVWAEMSATRRVPDVLAVEEWLAAAARRPTTVEEYAAGAARELRRLAGRGVAVTAVGRTATHGAIRVAVPAPPAVPAATRRGRA